MVSIIEDSAYWLLPLLFLLVSISLGIGLCLALDLLRFVIRRHSGPRRHSTQALAQVWSSQDWPMVRRVALLLVILPSALVFLIRSFGMLGVVLLFAVAASWKLWRRERD